MLCLLRIIKPSKTESNVREGKFRFKHAFIIAGVLGLQTTFSSVLYYLVHYLIKYLSHPGKSIKKCLIKNLAALRNYLTNISVYHVRTVALTRQFEIINNINFMPFEEGYLP